MVEGGEKWRYHKLQKSFGSRAHSRMSLENRAAQPHHSLAQSHQGQGTRESPKLTNTFCPAMLDENCFQAPLLPGNITLKDLRATRECSKSEPVCGTTPLLSTHHHCRKQGGKHGCALWLSTQKTPSRSSRNFHSLLQKHYWCLL